MSIRLNKERGQPFGAVWYNKEQIRLLTEHEREPRGKIPCNNLISLRATVNPLQCLQPHGRQVTSSFLLTRPCEVVRQKGLTIHSMTAIRSLWLIIFTANFSQVLGLWLQPRCPYYDNSHSIWTENENFTVWLIGTITLRCWRIHNWALFSAAIKKGVPQHVLPLPQVLGDPWWSQMRTKASSSYPFNVLTAPAVTHWAWCWCRPTTFSGDLCLWLDLM